MEEDFCDLLHRICAERNLRVADIAQVCNVTYQTAYCWMWPALPSLPGDEMAYQSLSKKFDISFKEVLAAAKESKRKQELRKPCVMQESEEAKLVAMLRVTGFAQRCPCRAAKFTSFASLEKVCAPKIAKGMAFCKKCPMTANKPSPPDYVQIVPPDKSQAGSYK
jgi:hypothetical protein